MVIEGARATRPVTTLRRPTLIVAVLISLALVAAGCGDDGAVQAPAAPAVSDDDILFELSEELETPADERNPLGCSAVDEEAVAEVFPELTGRRFVFDVGTESTCEWYNSSTSGITVGLRVYPDPAECVDRYPPPTTPGTDERVTLKRQDFGVLGWGQAVDAEGRTVCLLVIDNILDGDPDRVQTMFGLLATAIGPAS